MYVSHYCQQYRQFNSNQSDDNKLPTCQPDRLQSDQASNSVRFTPLQSQPIRISVNTTSQNNSFAVTPPTAPNWSKLPLYVDPNNEATVYYQSNSTVANANLIEREGQVPVAEWFGDWTPDVQSAANSYVTAAAQTNAVPVMVLYDIPERDCGGYSAVAPPV